MLQSKLRTYEDNTANALHDNNDYTCENEREHWEVGAYDVQR